MISIGKRVFEECVGDNGRGVGKAKQAVVSEHCGPNVAHGADKLKEQKLLGNF